MKDTLVKAPTTLFSFFLNFLIVIFHEFFALFLRAWLIKIRYSNRQRSSPHVSQLDWDAKYRILKMEWYVITFHRIFMSIFNLHTWSELAFDEVFSFFSYLLLLNSIISIRKFSFELVLGFLVCNLCPNILSLGWLFWGNGLPYNTIGKPNLAVWSKLNG